MKPNDAVIITDKKHPYYNQTGTLIRQRVFGGTWKGWLVKRDNGPEFYVKEKALKIIQGA